MSGDTMMLLHTADESILNSDKYIYEEKYDGERANLFVDKHGNITVIARSGRNITSEWPEFQELVLPPSSVFDGEIIVPSNIKFRDKPSTSGRSCVKSARQCELLAKVKPAVLMCFDVRRYAYEDVESRPLSERRAILNRVQDQVSFKKIEQFSDGKALWERVVSEGGEGVVAKKKNSIYQDRRSYDWLKIKTWQEGDFKVVGYTSEKREISALELEGGYKVNFAVSDAEYARLLPKLKANAGGFIAKVKYFSKSADGLRFPVLRELLEVGIDA